MEESIFDFIDVKALQIQDDTICKELCDDFWNRLIKSNEKISFPTSFLFRYNQYKLQWFAKYACVILMHKLDSRRTSISIIALDQWTYKVHESIHGRESTAIVAKNSKPTIFSIEPVQTNQLDNILQNLQNRIEKSEKNNAGNRRGHYNQGHTGNQKTPSFIRALLLEELYGSNDVDKNNSNSNEKNDSTTTTIQGGTTDVGLHTGCIRRNTSFPLVLAAIRIILQQEGYYNNDQDYYKLVIVYYLTYLRDIVKRIETFDTRQIDRAVIIMRTIEDTIQHINDEDTFISAVVQITEEHYTKLMNLRPGMDEQPVEVVSIKSVSEICKSLHSPEFPTHIPKIQLTQDHRSQMEKAKADSRVNLNLFNMQTVDFDGNIVNSFLRIFRLNIYFWNSCYKLNNDLQDSSSLYKIKTLRKYLQTFSEHIALVVKETRETPHIMTVTFRSYEVLSYWICFCWAHRIAEEKYRIFATFGAALDPADLSHLVLDDARALQALQEVRKFLKMRFDGGKYKPFRCKTDTLLFAKSYGQQSMFLKMIQKQEMEYSNELIEKRWHKIQQLKEELRSLDEELRNADGEYKEACRRFSESERTDYEWQPGRYNCRKVYNQTYYECLHEKERCWENVKTKRQEIKSLEQQRPPALRLSLPRNTEQSIQWLFFLFLPKEFEDLAALAQQAQSKLWETIPEAESPRECFRDWFEQHRQSKINDLAPRITVTIGSSTSIRYPGLPDIRNYTKETGIVDPGSLGLQLYWENTDPFRVDLNYYDTALYFTEVLPVCDKSEFMQQFVAMLPSNTRENDGIARRDMKPDWLSADQFIAFTSLRVGPYAQIRQFIEAIRDNSLPFQHNCVHVLVKQLLYHVGEDEWKTDLVLKSMGMTMLVGALGKQIGLLRESQKDAEKLLLFGILCSISAHLFPFLDPLGKHIIKSKLKDVISIFRRWGDRVSAEVDKAGRVDPKIYWKQAKFYGYGLLCHSCCVFKEGSDDLGGMAELLVLFKNRKLYASEIQESSSLDLAIAEVIAPHANKLVRFLNTNKDHLTTCLKLIIPHAPNELKWNLILLEDNSETGCFEAMSNQLFSINALTGTILVDGVPLGLLPSAIVEDPFYHRTFGDRNFEIVVNGFRQYQTARCVDGLFLYDFLVDASGNLNIREQQVGDPNRTLQLLRKDEIKLPVILRKNFSHWYCAEDKCVFLRAPYFRNRSINYVMNKDSMYHIDDMHSNSKDVMKLLHKCHRLLLGQSVFSRELEKFELTEYIHFRVDSCGDCLIIDLPRYKLSFEARDGRIMSRDFKGYQLVTSETMRDTIPGLSAFIALIHCTSGQQRILIRDGSIGWNASIKEDHEYNSCSCWSYHTFDVHKRFNYLTARTLVGRLHLAALYASTSCLLPDRRLKRTGVHIAVELVRQCWKNEPFSDSEELKLIEVSRFSTVSAVLSLACTWLWKSSQALRGLCRLDDLPRHKHLEMDEFALDVYRNDSGAPRLTSAEELSLLGSRQPKQMLPNHIVLPVEDSAIISFIRDMEKDLYDKHVISIPRLSNGPFPLSRPKRCTVLEDKIYKDDEKSFDTYSRLASNKVKNVSVDNLRDICAQVKQKRTFIEYSILNNLNRGNNSSKFHLSRMTGRILAATSSDILKLVKDEFSILRLNFNVDKNQERNLFLSSIDWAVLCVFEDKLNRLIHARDEHSLLTELECTRTWNPVQHRRWLAFEVEQQLQIRPNQYAIAKQLLKKPGSVIQLNMGLGKTRVLVPMLIMNGIEEGNIVRVTVLPSIIDEAIEYYRRTLVASIQNIKVFSLPFDRGCMLNEMSSGDLTDEMEKCKLHGGCIVVTPQHRNSLLLKQYDETVFVDGLKQTFLDILDESDALLSHDFQLVYALGTQEPLDNGPSRWTILQALLVVLARSKAPSISKFTEKSNLVHFETCTNGSFPNLRLLLPFHGHQHELGKALCMQLVLNPPYEFRWMLQVEDKDRDLLVLLMSDSSMQDVLKTIESKPLFAEKKSEILAGRGYIAFGLLFHGLESRYRVNYGLSKDAKTKMAVPYSACDTPKGRAQYSHPDMELVYTALTYLHQGLSQSEVRHALERLQMLGPIAQRAIYMDWIDIIRPDVPNEDLSKFDDIFKVDVQNMVQLDLIHRNMGRSMELIFFWTNNFIYPMETYQFSKKRASNAWNLVDGGRVAGFSGTDDNRFLLPLHVSQIVPEEDHLQATNGLMIQCILDRVKKICLLEESSEDSGPLWKVLLDNCIELRVDALIDVAGLMAGSDSENAAEYLSKTGLYKGVVYFDPNKSAWMVYESEHSRVNELHNSFLTESECFVYFDESRCRGSDMKLRIDAVGLVTIEAKMTKNKFLQGCARMRQLRESAQSLIVAGTSEAVSLESTAKGVLEKIMHHTSTSTMKNVLTFYERGRNFYQFPDPIEDKTSLEWMYGRPVPVYQDIAGYLDASHEIEEEQFKSKAGLKHLVEHCKSLGQGTPIAKAGNLVEECEQELENENEMQNEKETEFPEQLPYAQEDWPFDQAFTNTTSLFQNGIFVRLKDFISSKLPKLSSIKWSTKIFCTNNFCNSIRAKFTEADISFYLRPVGPMLVMQDGRVILLSSYELDNLLPEWWSSIGCGEPPATILCHLSGSMYGGDTTKTDISTRVLAMIKLFAGCVEYSSEEQLELVKILRSVPQVHEVVQNLLHMRNKLNHLDRSDLDDVLIRALS